MRAVKLSIVVAALMMAIAPSYAKAESCSVDNIEPVSIELVETKGKAKELGAASLDSGKIKTNIELREIGDYVRYKLVLRNNSEGQFSIEDFAPDNSGIVSYSIEPLDGEKAIGAGNTKEIFFTIKYNKKPTDSVFEDGYYSEKTDMNLFFSEEAVVPDEEPEPGAEDPSPSDETTPENDSAPEDEPMPNPNTAIGSPAMSFFMIVTLLSLAVIAIRKKDKRKTIAIIVLLAISLAPLKAYGECRCSVEIEANVTIPEYIGREISNIIMDDPIIDDERSDYMEPETGVNFLEPSSDTNGKGVYIFAPTKNDDKPIYYYRGAVENNNLIFADFCWKIFRTTETEGLKIIYNGIPTNGQCVAEGEDTMIATGVKYNADVKTLSYFGYSYASGGHTFSYMSNSRVTNGMIFANDVSYENGHYVLNDDRYVKDSNFASERDTVLKTHHYTCFANGADECATVRYVYMTRSVNMFYVTLKNGEKIEDVVDREVVNEANDEKSIVRTVVDDWYEQNMTAYTEKLEDTPWCNDRSLYEIGGWNKDNNVFEISNEQDGKMTFNTNYRVFTTGKPDINCTNKNDAFTVSSENGNGDLEYPVGLMTLDEAVMAGFNWYRYDDSSDNYLNNGMGWWLMSPSLVSANNIYVGVAYSRADHVVPTYTSNGLGGVRPMVSLKKGFEVSGGDGTSGNPFTLSD